jgi:hypothetical protein
MRWIKKPSLEALESRDVPSYVAAEFPGHGVWLSNTNFMPWTQLTTNNASQVAADSAGDLVAQFPGQGVWLYQGGGWKQLTANNAASLALGYSYEAQRFGAPIIHTYVVAQFPGQGLWLYTEVSGLAVASGWQQLTANNASTEGVDTNGHVVAEFPGWGVWFYTDGNGWRQLTPSDATSVAIGSTLYGYSRIVAEFPGWGVWRIVDTGGWVQLTAAEASTVGINQNGDVVGQFPNQGVWRFLDSGAAASAGFALGWGCCAGSDTTLAGIDAADNVFAQFNGPGVWIWNSVSNYWYFLNGNGASSLGVGG